MPAGAAKRSRTSCRSIERDGARRRLAWPPGAPPIGTDRNRARAACREMRRRRPPGGNRLDGRRVVDVPVRHRTDRRVRLSVLSVVDLRPVRASERGRRALARGRRGGRDGGAARPGRRRPVQARRARPVAPSHADGGDAGTDARCHGQLRACRMAADRARPTTFPGPRALVRRHRRRRGLPRRSRTGSRRPRSIPPARRAGARAAARRC